MEQLEENLGKSVEHAVLPGATLLMPPVPLASAVRVRLCKNLAQRRQVAVACEPEKSFTGVCRVINQRLTDVIRLHDAGRTPLGSGHGVRNDAADAANQQTTTRSK